MPQKKVLACVDHSHYADIVADYAAWAARQMAAPLEFLHIIDRHPERGSGEDHSGAIGFNAKEHLLNALSEKDAKRSRSAREAGRLLLNRLRERALAAGVANIDIRQYYGALVDTVVAQQDDVRLLVIGRRGVSAVRTQRDLGRNVESITRGVKCPVLTVTEHYRAPQRILIAYDGSAITRRGVEMVAAGQLFRGVSCHVVMSGKGSADADKKLEWAKATLEAAGFETETALIPGDPETVIAYEIQAREIDMLLMGAYTHSPLRKLLFGSKTDGLLRASKVPTLLLR